MNNENENQKVDTERASNNSLEIFKYSKPALSPSTDDFSTIQGAVDQLENMQKLAEVYVKGGLSPLKSTSDFVIAVITGNQLGLPFTVSINNIFPINGKPAMSVHLIRALLLQKGVTFKKTKDHTAIHQYFLTELDTEKGGNTRKAKLNGANQAILGGILPFDEIDQTMFIVNPKPSDYVTEYEFTRLIKRADGKYIEQKAKTSFSIKDSVAAGLDEKDNWKKYPSAMLDARAFMKGAREVASDIIFGLYSVDELADAQDIPYTMDEAGNQSIIHEATFVK
jgi:hypothetical protein